MFSGLASWIIVRICYALTRNLLILGALSRRRLGLVNKAGTDRASVTVMESATVGLRATAVFLSR